MNGPRETGSQWTVDTLREHFIALFSEKEKRDQEVLKRLDGVAGSQEKAVTKAEEAQKEYNARSNEFRGQLDDQNKLQITRTEALQVVGALGEKVEGHKRERERDIAQLRVEIQGLRESRSAASPALNQIESLQKEIGQLRVEIQGLRESRSAGTGKTDGLSTGWKYLMGALVLISMLLALRDMLPK